MLRQVDGELRELASGVDALYLSGRAALSAELVGRLEAGRGLAETSGSSVSYRFGGEDWEIAPRGVGKYRFRLDHHRGMVGLSVSEKLPAISVQPRSEFLHGAGAEEAVEWFRQVIEAECGAVLFSAKRLDLHADWQGWDLVGDDRHRFICRARARDTHEEGEDFTGLEFGRRSTGTVCARIYDKTVESAKKGTGFWKDIWGPAFDPDVPVLRVEFELGRQGLREYGINSPESAVAAAGSLWMDLTQNWLSYRVATSDQTKARWPVAPEWERISRASLTEDVQGIDRMYTGKRRGELEKLAPGLMGYLAGFAALRRTSKWHDTVFDLGRFVRWYEDRTGVGFATRVADRVKAYGLP